MTIARAIRLLLSFAAIAIVAWSFFDVGRRAVKRRMAERDRPITLTVLHWGNPGEDRIVKNLCETYQAQNPKVRIIRINTGDSGAMRNKLKTMMAAGQPPDLFYLPP